MGQAHNCNTNCIMNWCWWWLLMRLLHIAHNLCYPLKYLSLHGQHLHWIHNRRYPVALILLRVVLKWPLVPRCPPVPIREALIVASSLILIIIIVVAVCSVHHLMIYKKIRTGCKRK